ncbi:MAG: hypothetical protein Q7S92_00030 [Candidatus Diapherotrites archaeon]|nr:hypothetical protein [Candidatus Diapherotrites archaeon]
MPKPPKRIAQKPGRRIQGIKQPVNLGRRRFLRIGLAGAGLGLASFFGLRAFRRQARERKQLREIKKPFPEEIRKAAQVEADLERMYKVKFPGHFSEARKTEARENINAALLGIYNVAPDIWAGLKLVKLEIEFGDVKRFEAETNAGARGGIQLTTANAVTRGEVRGIAREPELVSRTVFDENYFARNPKELLPVAIHELAGNAGLIAERFVKFKGQPLTPVDRIRMEVQAHRVGIIVMERMLQQIESRANYEGAQEIMQTLRKAIEHDQAFLQHFEAEIRSDPSIRRALGPE